MSYKSLSYFCAAKHLHVEAGKVNPHRVPADGAFCDYQLQLAAINYVAELARAVGGDIMVANGDGETLARRVAELRPEMGRIDGRAPETDAKVGGK